MKYLHLRISTEARGTIYERDVRARDALESFIRGGVSSLVRGGVIFAGEHYSAVVIPRYGDTMMRGAKVSDNSAKAGRSKEWIELQFEEPSPDDRPISYFSVELHLSERQFIYRRDFSTLDVAQAYVTAGIEQALVSLGLLRPREYYFTAFYARDDDKGQFDRERLPSVERDSAALVEIVADQPDQPAFPMRDAGSYGVVQAVGQPAAGDIRIYVRRPLLAQLVEETKRSEEQQIELGGLLIGEVFAAADGGRHIVEVSDVIVSEHTRSSITELRYTFDSWQASSTRLRTEFPGKRIVGWYHTHLVQMAFYTDESRRQVELTSMFFSRDDLFLHKNYFPDEWYVALVLDPAGNSVFFQWKDGDILVCGGYYIFDDIGVAEAG